MNWTTEEPTVDGWYVWRDGTETEFVGLFGGVYYDAYNRPVKSYLVKDGEWFGPMVQKGE